MSADVFISYSHADRDYARTLTALLREAGVAVWFDESELVPGTAWRPAIRDAIRGCDSFLMLVGSTTPGWVSNEVRVAIQEGKKIVPLLLPGSDPAGLVQPLRELPLVDCRTDPRSTRSLIRVAAWLAPAESGPPDYEKVGDRLRRHGDPREALACYEWALTAGRDSRFLHLKLGETCLQLGDLRRARRHFESALTGDEALHGPDSPAVAADLSRLAAVYFEEGDYERARAILDRALAIEERHHGPAHTAVASLLSSISNVTRAMGDLAHARASAERALAINESALGPRHPAVAKCLANLGGIIQATGDHLAAVALFQRALDINAALLGPGHPGVASSYSNLGGALYEQGLVSDARRMFERALAIDLEVYGEEHAQVATDLSNLAETLRRMGDRTGARALLLRALSTSEMLFGGVHPSVAAVRNNLGSLLADMGDTSGAVMQFERAIQLYEASGDRNLAAARANLTRLLLARRWPEQPHFTLPPQLVWFARGAPSLDIIDVDGLSQAAVRAFAQDPGGVTAYGNAYGYPPLRQWIARKHDVSPDQVLITNGSLQALAFLFDELVRPGDHVVVERPTYDRTLRNLQQHGAIVHQVTLQPDGIDTVELRRLLESGVRIKLAHVIPTFQNPAGVTLSLPKREELVALAREFGFHIVEDDPYADIRFRGEPLPSMLSLDAERTVYTSSFTKTVCPGVRVGYLIGPEAFVDTIAKRVTGLHISAGQVAQGLVHQFCVSGDIDRSIATIRQVLAERASALAEALRRHIPEARFVEPDGGYYLWVDLPSHVHMDKLMPAAAEHGVAFVKGSDFLLEGGDHSLRLAFSAVTVDQIEAGVRQLAAALYSAIG